MLKACALLLVLFMVCVSLPGCLSYQGNVKVDDIMGKIDLLQKDINEKLSAAGSGELSVSEALEFVTSANEQVSKLREELKDVRDSEGASTAELIGSVIASILGTTGFIRAWRGPSHKATLG